MSVHVVTTALPWRSQDRGSAFFVSYVWYRRLQNLNPLSSLHSCYIYVYNIKLWVTITDIYIVTTCDYVSAKRLGEKGN
jgi:hypothetical protein